MRHASRWAGRLLLLCLAGSGTARAGELASVGLGLRVSFNPEVPLRFNRIPYSSALIQPVRDRVREYLGRDFSPSELNGSLPGGMVFAPMLTLGGDGYFARFEVPLTLRSDFKSIGFGVYPIGYGYYISALRLMPYALLGGSVSYARLHSSFPVYSEGSPTQEAETVGQRALIVETRLALGARFFALRHFPVSLELGWSPYTIAAMADTSRLRKFRNGDVQTLMTQAPSSALRGGVGHFFALSAGMECF